MSRVPRILLTVALLFSVMPNYAFAQDTHEMVNQEMSKPVIRGGIVFKTYCVVCHGERGDGVARAAKLYSGLNLSIKPRSSEYYAKIIRQGGELFKANCVLCHGVRADGMGRAAKLFSPPPANLMQSDKTDEYKERIIRLGGESLQRSSGMPAWSERLSNKEIADVVRYLRTIVTVPPAH